MPKKVTLDDLAMMVKKGFDETASKAEVKDLHQELSDFRKENQSEHKRMGRAIGNLEFIATEMVRRNEFLELKKEVEILKQKIA